MVGAVIPLRHFTREKIERSPTNNLAGAGRPNEPRVRVIVEEVAALGVFHVDAVGQGVDQRPQEVPVVRNALIQVAQLQLRVAQCAGLVNGVLTCGDEQIEHLQPAGADLVVLSPQLDIENILGRRRGWRGMGQQQADAREKIVRVARPRQTGIRAGIESIDNFLWLAERTEKNDRDSPQIGIVLQRAAQLAAGHIRQHHIADDEIRRLGPAHIKRAAPTGCDPRRMAATVEQGTERFRLGGALCCDENISHLAKDA